MELFVSECQHCEKCTGVLMRGGKNEKSHLGR